MKLAEKMMRLDSARENFEEMIADLPRDGNWEYELESEYPEAIINLTFDDEPPKLEVGQGWACDCGCGEITPVIVPFVSLSRFSSEGGLKECTIEGIWGSPCQMHDGRNYGAEAFDRNTDQFIKPTLRLEGQ